MNDDFAVELCSTLDLDDARELAEALIIAISSVKNKDGKLLALRLGKSLQEEFDYATQVAETLLKARELQKNRLEESA